jgi:hypothetical protein
MSSDNVLYLSSLDHTNSTKTWPSFVYHSPLTICDCLRFTKVCFCSYTSEKQFCLNDINSSSGIDLADAPALCGYLDDVTLHVDDLNVCGL